MRPGRPNPPPPAPDPREAIDQRFWEMIERLPSGVIVHHEQGTIMFANTPAARLAGATSGEALVGRPITDLFPLPYLKGVRELLLGLRAHDAETQSARARLFRLDGAEVDVEVAAMPFVAGTHGEVQLVFHDIGRRLAAEAALEHTVTQIHLVLAHLPGTLWTTDRAGRITASHAHGRAVPGIMPWISAPPGTPIEAVLGEPNGPLVAEANTRALQGETAACEIGIGDRIVSVEVAPLRRSAHAEDAEIIGTVGLAIDVTERRQRERRRREQERLDALARLAGGVAHEVNNVLASVISHATVLRMEHKELEGVADLDAIVTASQRGGRVSSRLLGFAREGLYQRESLDAVELVRAAADRAREDAPHNVEVVYISESGPQPIEGDLKQLSTILDALTENALDAMVSHGGTLTLRADMEELGPEEIPWDDIAASSFSRIEVTDTGCGMPEAVRERAIEPYFTTRGDGRGLGLSMVYGVVRHHGGFTHLKSAVGVGTTARVYLPLAMGPLRTSPLSRTPPPPTGPSPWRGTVLVVDDEAAVRRVMSRLLTLMGFTVIEAEDGPTALTLFAEAREEPIGMVLLDMRMPRMGGDEVLRRLLELDPEVRVVLCTGYDRDQITQGLFALGRVGFLQKPYGIDELEREVARVRAL